jgi:hypothetical protein
MMVPSKLRIEPSPEPAFDRAVDARRQLGACFITAESSWRRRVGTPAGGLKNISGLARVILWPSVGYSQSLDFANRLPVAGVSTAGRTSSESSGGETRSCCWGSNPLGTQPGSSGAVPKGLTALDQLTNPLGEEGVDQLDLLVRQRLLVPGSGARRVLGASQELLAPVLVFGPVRPCCRSASATELLPLTTVQANAARCLAAQRCTCSGMSGVVTSVGRWRLHVGQDIVSQPIGQPATSGWGIL